MRRACLKVTIVLIGAVSLVLSASVAPHMLEERLSIQIENDVGLRSVSRLPLPENWLPSEKWKIEGIRSALKDSDQSVPYIALQKFNQFHKQLGERFNQTISLDNRLELAREIIKATSGLGMAARRRSRPDRRSDVLPEPVEIHVGEYTAATEALELIVTNVDIPALTELASDKARAPGVRVATVKALLSLDRETAV